MQYSPKLKRVMEDIRAILKKEDIAGFIVIHEPGFSEYLNNISTGYSCASIQNGELRFRLKSSEVGKEQAKKIATDTINMMTHLARVTGTNAIMFMDAEKLLKEKLGGYDLPGGGHTSHNQQNN